jgi:hypothetical protein
MFQHFRNKLMLTLTDLRNEFVAQSGIWQAFSMPSRDEMGSSHSLGYYEGDFEDVLQAVHQDHGREFHDNSGECGEIIRIQPKRIVAESAHKEFGG